MVKKEKQGIEEMTLMTTEVRNLLRSFDSLPDSEKRELAAEILRRSVRFDLLPLSDEDLTKAADDIFLAIDREEA
jgi:hypothetical protein